MRPYRLINASELHELNCFFSPVLAHWNEEYCVQPLGLELALTPQNYSAASVLMIRELDKDLALLEGDYLSVMSQALFGEHKDCFNSASQELLLSLLSKLLQTKLMPTYKSLTENPQWFYPGSTSLLLTLSGAEAHFTLMLNPDWVYQQLPQNSIKCVALNSLDEALEGQTLRLNLELIPSNLSVKNLMGIQVGDILTTNHPLTTALHLSRENQVFAQVELGQSASHKSILIKRSS